ncbi:DUF2218 domain-containing protein [Mesorhizobium sp. NPDC059054]|uniref:DUF2218 domain-containing protein n=1 Tax=Mesorhizobium sp. NPDC059054 TaxID=3346711 RepID=UPI0036CCA673
MIQKLCSSFVEYASTFGGQRGQIRLPFGWCQLQAKGAKLHITLGAENPADLARVDAIVVGRLKRVSHRHGRDLIWAHVERRHYT